MSWRGWIVVVFLSLVVGPLIGFFGFAKFLDDIGYPDVREMAAMRARVEAVEALADRVQALEAAKDQESDDDRPDP